MRLLNVCQHAMAGLILYNYCELAPKLHWKVDVLHCS